MLAIKARSFRGVRSISLPLKGFRSGGVRSPMMRASSRALHSTRHDPIGESVSDPIFPDKALVPSAEEHPVHERHEAGLDWVVVHRGGAGSKAHVEALEHKLTKAHINSRVAHDDEHRVILEVQREQETQALTVLGEPNTH